MPYIVKPGKRVIYGDADGLHHRYGPGEVVAGAERPDLDRCRAVEWISEKHAAVIAEEDLHRKSNRELREMCEERGLEANLRMNKDELVGLLEGVDSDEGGDDGLLHPL